MTRYDFIISHIAPEDMVINIGCCGDDWEFEEAWNSHASLHQTISDHIGLEKLVGVDINERRIEQVRQMGYTVQKASAENLSELPQSYSEKFDVVVAGDVIEHLSAPGLFLESVKRVLKPEGRLVLTTPNIYGFWFWFLYGVLRRTEPWPEHVCYYTPCTLRQMLKRHKWNIAKMQIGAYGNAGRRFRAIKAIPEFLEQMRPCLKVVAQRSE